MCTAVLGTATFHTRKCNTKQGIIFTDNTMLLQAGRNIGCLCLTFHIINNSGPRKKFGYLLNLAVQTCTS